MTGVLSSELLKIRSVRSTTYVLLALALMLLTGAVVSYLMTSDWDVASPERQQRFDRADPGVVVVPFGQFCLGALGALAVTSEYGSGMIRTALVSVPRRGTFLLAKIVVVGAVSLVVAAARSPSRPTTRWARPCRSSCPTRPRWSCWPWSAWGWASCSVRQRAPS
ncbi:hypothetical protein K7G98_24705 [Saccharothrix sp. MB29]|nr:hypothetical protein [Saccharothrix sp. MB29]